MTFLRRLFGVVALAALAVGAAAVLRNRFAGPRERVDLYYEDGSMTTVATGSAEGSSLLGYARDALSAARTS